MWYDGLSPRERLCYPKASHNLMIRLVFTTVWRCMKHAVLDLHLCLSVLKHRASFGRVASSSCQFFYDGFLLMWCNFKFEDVLFRSDSRHNDRVHSLFECAIKQVVMTVAQWNRNKIIRGLCWLGSKKVEDGLMLTWCNFKPDGVMFNLDTYRRM